MSDDPAGTGLRERLHLHEVSTQKELCNYGSDKEID